MSPRHQPLRKMQKIVFYSSILVTIVLSCISIIYWVAHPELSQMQVSLKLWWMYPSIILAAIGFNWGNDYEQQEN